MFPFVMLFNDYDLPKLNILERFIEGCKNLVICFSLDGPPFAHKIRVMVVSEVK